MTNGRPQKIFRTRSTGFTLVELLVALLISTMILGAAAAVFNTVLRGWERGNNAYRVLRAARTISELLETNLRAAVPPAQKGQLMMIGEDLSDGTTGGHRLTLVSAAPNRLAGGGPLAESSIIEFRFDPAAGEPMKMRVSPGSDNIYDQNGYEVELSSLATSFQVRYFDGTAWVNSWLQQGLPVAVEFHVTIADPSDAVPGDTTSSSNTSSSSGSSGGQGSQNSNSAPSSGSTGSSSDEFTTLGPPGYRVVRLITIPMGNVARTPRVVTATGGEF